MASITVTAKERRDKKKSGGSSKKSVNNTNTTNRTNQTAEDTWRTEYDSVPVIGSMDGDNYNNYGIKQGTGTGYGEGNGYGNRESGYTFTLADGTNKTIFSNATNYKDAAKLAGIDLNSGAKLAYATTYGTKSSAYSPKGYGFGAVQGANDFTTNLYASNKQTGNLYDMNNMELAFLSGRDGRDYTNHYADLTYKGNGLQNAYNKGTDFAGQGEVMGGYNVNFEYPDRTLDSFIADGGDYSTLNSVYGSAFANANNAPVKGTTSTSGDVGLPAQALAQIQAYQTQYKAAEAEFLKTGSAEAKKAMEQAHAAAETVRSQYGYSGGADGGGAYTPLGTYNDAGLPADTLSQIKQLQADYQAAVAKGDKAAANAAHAAAEAIRSQYSYSGGIDGSDYLGWGNAPYNAAYAPLTSGFNWDYEKPEFEFDYERPDEYDSEYKDFIDKLLGQILNRDDFSYDVNGDPLYQQYKSEYLREGQRAMNDTLAAAASGAGGMNSYALAAAQQAQNYFDAQLGDKIPELYQLAYDMWLNDINRDVQNMGLLQNLDETQYGRYRDTVNDWYNDRNFAYGAYRDDVGDYYNDKNFAYGQYRDSVGDSQWQQQFNYNANRDAIADKRYDTEWSYSVQSDAYDQAMKFLAAGVMPSAELLNRAGLSQSDARNYISATLSGSSGSGRKSSGSGSEESSSEGSGSGGKNAVNIEDSALLNAFNYRGSLFNSESGKSSSGGDTDNFYTVSRTVRSMYDNGKSDDYMADYIANRIEDKTITPQEAARIATNYGINL